MKLTREGASHAYSRAKNIGTQAWHTTKRVLNTTDKLATLAAHGLVHISDRLDSDTKQYAAGALRGYANRRSQVGAVMDNTERVGNAFRDAGFEL